MALAVGPGQDEGGGAVRAVLRRSGRGRRSLVPLAACGGDRVAVLLEGPRKAVAALAVGDEVEEIRLGGRGGRLERRQTGVADGSRRQACVQVRVVVGVVAVVGAVESAGPLAVALERVGDGGVGLQAHPAAEAVRIDARDDRLLAQERGFLLHDRRERHGVPQRQAALSGPLPQLGGEVLAEVREHRLHDLTGRGRSRDLVGVREQEAIQVRSPAADRGDQLRMGKRVAEGLGPADPPAPEQLEGLLGGQPLRNHDDVAHDVAAAHAVDDPRQGHRPLEAILAGLERRGAARQSVIGLREPGEAQHALHGQALEDHRGRRAQGKEDRDVGCRGNRGGVFHLAVQVKRRREGQDGQEQTQAEKPAARAHRAPGATLWR